VETKAKTAVMKALQLDSNLAEALASLGYLKFRIDRDWVGAEGELTRAFELKPGYATAHEWYALLLGVRVKLDEAVSEMQTAYNLDPLSPSVNNGLARVYHFRNDDRKALEQIKKTIELEPGYAEAHFTLGMTYIRLKDYKAAEKELKQAIDLSGRRPVMLGMLGRLYVLQGRINDAKTLLDETETPPMNNDKLYASSVIKFTEGRYDEAFAQFDKLASDKYGIMIYMKVEKTFFNTPDPRYDALIKKIGL
jgi:Flp pilus assembly protein TadD